MLRPTCPTLSNQQSWGWTLESLAAQASAQPSNLLLLKVKSKKRNQPACTHTPRSLRPSVPGDLAEKGRTVGRIRRIRCATTILAVQPCVLGLGIVQPTVGQLMASG